MRHREKRGWTERGEAKLLPEKTPPLECSHPDSHFGSARNPSGRRPPVESVSRRIASAPARRMRGRKASGVVRSLVPPIYLLYQLRPRSACSGMCAVVPLAVPRVVMVMVMVIYSALVRSHQSTPLVASASCVARGYNTRAQPCLKQDVEGLTRPPRSAPASPIPCTLACPEGVDVVL